MPATTPGDRLTISIVAGLVVERDAISNICRQQLRAVERRLERDGVPYAVRVYAAGSDVEDSRIRLTSDPAGLIADEHFLASDLIVYQFGIYHPLFDSILFAPRPARVVVCYYGVTPPGCVRPSERGVIFRSYEQAVNLHCADLVVTGSRHLHRELLGMGVPPEKLAHNPYCVPFRAGEGVPEKAWARDRLRLVYVGRYAPAKGLWELLRAVDRVRRTLPVELTMVGTRRFTEPGFLEEMADFIRERRLGDSVRCHFDVPEGELLAHLRAADVLVIPSYHEGFCVPVVEAMSAGCFVVCSDAGALPETSGGLGLVCPAGDAEALAARLGEFAARWREGVVPTGRGPMSYAEWRRAAAEHLRTFARENFERTFTGLLFEGLRPTGDEARSGLSARRRELLAELRRPGAQAPAPRPADERLRGVIREGYRPRTGYAKFAPRRGA
ncbi:MAG TPA: glycosyltransferase family 4 protein [Gemmataceae bacterium]